MISSQKIHWIAGLLEGEGSFSLTTTNKAGERGIRITLSMTDRDVVERLANMLGFGSIHIVNYKRYAAHYKVQYRWGCGGARAAALMMTLYSLLGERRQQRVRELLNHWKAMKWGAPRRKPRKVFSFS